MTVQDCNMDARSRDGDNQSKPPVNESAAGLGDTSRFMAEQFKYLDAFFRCALTPLVLLDRNFNFIRVNEAYAKACQKRIEDFLGHNHFEYYPSDAKEIFDDVVRTKQSFQIAARPFVFPDHPDWGVTYWNWTLTPLLDEKGEVDALVFALEDVTASTKAQIELEQHRKRLEEMVRERTRELETANTQLQMEVNDRKLAQEERESLFIESDERRRQLDAILAALPVGVSITDRNGRAITNNEILQSIWGGKAPLASNIEEYNFYKAWFADTGKPVEAEEWTLSRAMRAGKAIIGDVYNIERFDGTRGRIILSSAPVRDAGGTITNWISIVQDITDRMEGEAKLAYLASFPERNPNPVMEVDLEGNIRYANPAARSLFPDLQEHGLAHPWLSAWADTVRPLRLGQTETGTRELTIGDRVYDQILNYSAQDGYVRIYGMDITERKRAEEALRESEARYRGVVQNTSAVILRLNPQGVICFANKRAMEFFGYGEDELVGKPALGTIVPERETAGRDLAVMVEEITADPDRFHTNANENMRKSGERVWMEWTNSGIYDSEGRLKEFLSVGIDATERKQAEETLRETDRQKNQFLATLSHELRNPLAAIRTSLDILERVPPGGEQADRAKAVIDRQSGQLAHLVDDLLDVSRITQNKIVLQWERMELNELLRRVFEDFQTAFVMNGLSLLYEFDPSPIYLTADRTRLAQVFGNLLQNAVKFTPRGGRVIVSTALDREAGRVLVRVADTGIGIEPEMIPRLFKPFAQIDTGLDRHNGGLGLGLALVKGLIELHGGEVSVASLGSGQGTEFTIMLPWQEEKEEEVKSTAALPSRRRRILIIEDNADLAESLRELLELEGHEVETAQSGPEGLAMAHQKQPEVLLCDIGLPGMDGYAVARAFREDERFKVVFLVALTGYAQPEDLEKVMAAGFDRHLAKPVELETIERMLGEGME